VLKGVGSDPRLWFQRHAVGFRPAEEVVTVTVQEQVHKLLAPVVATLSVELFDVEFSGNVLRVVVDEGEGITTDRLAQVNRLISPILDQHDPVPGRYTLEVSSPGLERPLRRASHFERAVGEEIVVKMVPPLKPRRYRGRLAAISLDAPSPDPAPADLAPAAEVGGPEPAVGGSVPLTGTLTLEVAEVDGVPTDGGERCELPLADVASARTVFSWGPGPKPGQPGARKKSKPDLPSTAEVRDEQ
jgi:ribosome maturation factor RimP